MDDPQAVAARRVSVVLDLARKSRVALTHARAFGAAGRARTLAHQVDALEAALRLLLRERDGGPTDATHE